MPLWLASAKLRANLEASGIAVKRSSPGNAVQTCSQPTRPRNKLFDESKCLYELKQLKADTSKDLEERLQQVMRMVEQLCEVRNLEGLRNQVYKYDLRLQELETEFDVTDKNYFEEAL